MYSVSITYPVYLCEFWVMNGLRKHNVSRKNTLPDFKAGQVEISAFIINQPGDLGFPTEGRYSML